MEGKVALVTGASHGIGLASSLAFLARGASVVAADLAPPAAGSSPATPGLTSVAADVTRPADVRRAVAACLETHGRIDFLHNNAGVSSSGYLLHEMPPQEWDRVLDLNLRGAWLVLKHALAPLRESRGAVVNTASVAGLVGRPRRAAYSASKAALIALTRVAAAENAAAGVRVNAVAPGSIGTAMQPEGVSGGPEPSGRLGSAEEVAEAVVWLCSQDASFVNGACLAVDGGWTSHLPDWRIQTARKGH
jgi:NAD(P)-dependent dehydrogenase (short-subunit alcohol dehydrogenase family)